MSAVSSQISTHRFSNSNECEVEANASDGVQQEELSPIDYKTQASLTMLLGGCGLHHSYAGNHSQALAKLAVCTLLSPFVKGGIWGIRGIIWLVSLIQLSSGQYTDANGKVIRQVVQLKKEEMSDCDQKIALILSIFLGVIGAHQFYAGKPLKGMLMLCSLGGLGIWYLVNIYQLVTCGFKDGKGKWVCPDYIVKAASNPQH